MTRFCTSCGAELSDSQKYCTSCGAVTEPAGDAGNATVSSPDVTQELPIDQAAAAQSYAAQTAPAEPAPAAQPATPSPAKPAAEPTKKTVPVGALIGGICAVVLTAVGVFMVLTIVTPKPEGKATETTTQTTDTGSSSETASDEGEGSDAEGDTENSEADSSSSDSDSSDSGTVNVTINNNTGTGNSSTSTSTGTNTGSSSSSSDYILPDSSARVYSASELQSYSQYELMLARNEIYARYGRGFNDQEIRQYFESKSWYHQKYTAEQFDSMASPLNSIEQQNVDTIYKVEHSK